MQNNQILINEPRVALSSIDIPDTTAFALVIASLHFPVGVADGVKTSEGAEVDVGFVAVVGLVSFRTHNPRR